MKRKNLSKAELAYVLQQNSLFRNKVIFFGVFPFWVLLTIWLIVDSTYLSRIEIVDLTINTIISAFIFFAIWNLLDFAIDIAEAYIRVGFHPNPHDLSDMFWYFWSIELPKNKFKKKVWMRFVAEYKGIRKIRRTQQIADSVTNSKEKRELLNKMLVYAESLFNKYYATLTAELLQSELDNANSLKQIVSELESMPSANK